jgi:hypothetical protein
MPRGETKMKVTTLAAVLAVSLCSSVAMYAQEKPNVIEVKDTPKVITALRVQVTLSEYEGEKKISSLPYTLLVNAGDLGHRQPTARIRMGLRLPVAVGPSQFQYQDVGTNLDCSALTEPDGRFNLHLGVEKSSVYSPNAGQKLGNEISSGNPVTQTFKSELDLLIRDGQTIQLTAATDPVSGRVTKAEVTVNVMK